MPTDTPRILPIDDDAERAVLASILIQNAALDLAGASLRPEAFTAQRHQAIFEAMLDQRLRGEPIDLVTLAAQLDGTGQLDRAGGRAYLAELALAVASASDIGRYVSIVRDRWVQRSLIRLFTDVADRAYGMQNPDELVEMTTRALFVLFSEQRTLPWINAEQTMSDTTDDLDERRKRTGTLEGWPTGLRDLDKTLGGLKPGELVIVGARPSMGKTALACDMALAASAEGARVGFVSLEMTARQIGFRLLANVGSLDLRNLADGNLTAAEWRSVANAGSTIAQRPLWFDESNYLTMDQLRLKTRMLATTAKGLDLLIVDYLQLLSTESKRRESRQQEISEISRELKLLAKELNICVIALSQLSRACENREDKRPVLADLRDSGAIEQDADAVIFLYRDEVYNPESDEEGLAELIVRKNRQGQVGTVKAVFQAPFSRFLDYAQGISA